MPRMTYITKCEKHLNRQQNPWDIWQYIYNIYIYLKARTNKIVVFLCSVLFNSKCDIFYQSKKELKTTIASLVSGPLERCRHQFREAFRFPFNL